MIYSNSDSALSACESARTGRYGTDEYEYEYYNDDHEEDEEEDEDEDEDDLNE